MSKFKNYEHTDNDGETSVIRVRVIDADENGEQVQTTGGIVPVSEGSVVIDNGNPNAYDVLTREQFAESGYVEHVDPVAGPTEPSVPVDDFAALSERVAALESRVGIQGPGE